MVHTKGGRVSALPLFSFYKVQFTEQFHFNKVHFTNRKKRDRAEALPLLGTIKTLSYFLK